MRTPQGAFLVGQGLREKLRGMVAAYDDRPIGGGAMTIPVRHERLNQPSNSASVIEAYFTGAWIKGATKQITFLGNTATTATAVNLIRTIPLAVGQTARSCTVAARSVSSPDYVLLNSEC
jgi:hypothetical protein